jgi:uncharacterized protein with WD repeat
MTNLKNLIKNPVDIKVLEVSTRHITPEDGKLIELDSEANLNYIIYSYPEGAFVFSGCEQFEYFKGFSKEFNDIMEFARQNGYDFVRFDAEAEVYEELSKFNW